MSEQARDDWWNQLLGLAGTAEQLRGTSPAHTLEDSEALRQYQIDHDDELAEIIAWRDGLLLQLHPEEAEDLPAKVLKARDVLGEWHDPRPSTGS